MIETPVLDSTFYLISNQNCTYQLFDVNQHFEVLILSLLFPSTVTVDYDLIEFNLIKIMLLSTQFLSHLTANF